MNWTTEQALDAWCESIDDKYDPDWDKTVCDLLLGKVEMDVVVKILNIMHSTIKEHIGG